MEFRDIGIRSNVARTHAVPRSVRGFREAERFVARHVRNNVPKFDVAGLDVHFVQQAQRQAKIRFELAFEPNRNREPVTNGCVNHYGLLFGIGAERDELIQQPATGLMVGTELEVQTGHVGLWGHDRRKAFYRNRRFKYKEQAQVQAGKLVRTTGNKKSRNASHKRWETTGPIRLSVAAKSQPQ